MRGFSIVDAGEWPQRADPAEERKVYLFRRRGIRLFQERATP